MRVKVSYADDLEAAWNARAVGGAPVAEYIGGEKILWIDGDKKTNLFEFHGIPVGTKLYAHPPVPVRAPQGVTRTFTEEDYCALQRGFEKLRYIAENSFPAKDHDLDGGKRSGTIRDAMLYAKSALKGYEAALCHISDDMFTNPLAATQPSATPAGKALCDCGKANVCSKLPNCRINFAMREAAKTPGTTVQIFDTALPGEVQVDAARTIEDSNAKKWRLTVDKGPVQILYTALINGEQACRDDLWLVKTSQIAAIAFNQSGVKPL